ncbi:uncharacterized protein LOC122860007 [Aphidius gifuensis]|uniref:uncharacterized protein LOC122855146 n=1 Tax=Aphidius gifuensis TaxID=684658 RepID=UPI001CDCDE7E|nr:uncharacterized protein LOC122855146 [Aphidius gifuensis]XP_044019584.1 uncharacterized protein LOC122860007 [Aphidius gifuensis]
MNQWISLILLMGLFFTLSNALECYVCDNQEDNKHKCLQSIKTCEQDEDVCMTEVKWGSAPYWTVGAKKQYYISKKCATESHCRRIREKNMPDCTYLWYVDWKCSECCRGDRCNYFIFSSASKFSISMTSLLTVTLFVHIVKLF